MSHALPFSENTVSLWQYTRCDGNAALEHFANIGHLLAPLMECATITGELLGAPSEQIRRNLTGDQPKLFTPWMALRNEPAATD
jgi:hypothetical protein